MELQIETTMVHIQLDTLVEIFNYFDTAPLKAAHYGLSRTLVGMLVDAPDCPPTASLAVYRAMGISLADEVRQTKEQP